MSIIGYNQKASDLALRRARANHYADVALAKNEAQFSEGVKWALYVFAFFVVTAASVFAVAGALPR